MKRLFKNIGRLGLSNRRVMLKEGIKRTGVATLLVGGMQYSVNQYKVK